jgi:hypothetical protein
MRSRTARRGRARRVGRRRETGGAGGSRERQREHGALRPFCGEEGAGATRPPRERARALPVGAAAGVWAGPGAETLDYHLPLPAPPAASLAS